jgi:hypothetical protein
MTTNLFLLTGVFEGWGALDAFEVLEERKDRMRDKDDGGFEYCE